MLVKHNFQLEMMFNIHSIHQPYFLPQDITYICLICIPTKRHSIGNESLIKLTPGDVVFVAT